ncbi:MAG: hypothetical protein JST21_16645 [Bacteroidetes bacterium]|nr:hypothetical protein [Bacteroidota bacterium]
MKILKNLICALLLLPLVSSAQEKPGRLLNITEITVKPGHDAQFVQAVKLWKECYLKNKGTDHLSVWHRVQGKGNVYVLTGSMANWAEMDKADPAGKACRDIAINLINPNIESTENSIARDMPDFSGPAMDSIKLIWVTFFKVSNNQDFMDILKDMSAAIKTANGNLKGYWHHILGGDPESPNYFVTDPYKSFADLDNDNDNDSPWEIYEKVNGKKAADEIRAKFRSATENVWSYLYTLEKDLSN